MGILNIPASVRNANTRELSRYLKGFGVKGYSKMTPYEKKIELAKIARSLKPGVFEGRLDKIHDEMRMETIKRGHTL